MKKLILICFMIVISISLVSALCNEGQIDINSAGLEKLDEIVYIGLDRAEQIINLRPFSSINDLIRVSGIGEVYLDKIIEQGLTCVENEYEKLEEEEEIIKEVIEEKPEPEELKVVSSGSITAEIIKLEPLETKDIKSNDDKKWDKSDYAKYGFVIFCVLLGFLFILRKNRFKNEFG